MCVFLAQKKNQTSSIVTMTTNGLQEASKDPGPILATHDGNEKQQTEPSQRLRKFNKIDCSFNQIILNGAQSIQIIVID